MFTRDLYDSTLDDDRVYLDAEGRFALLLAINQAKQDVLYGINDNACLDEEKPMVRIDALLFFCDSRYTDYLELCGIYSENLPPGIGLWIKRFGHLCRSKGWSPWKLDDKKAIMHAFLAGYLHKDMAVWDEAKELYHAILKQSLAATVRRYRGKVIGGQVLGTNDWRALVEKLGAVGWAWSREATVGTFDGALLPGVYDSICSVLEDDGIISGNKVTHYGQAVMNKLAKKESKLC